MYQDFWEGRKYNVSKNSEYANQSFVILPTNNNGRLNTLAEKLKAQDIEVYVSTSPIQTKSALKQTGDMIESFTIPSGSMIIPNLQPEAPLIAAILEFDAEIIESVLEEERRKTLKNSSSIMYDTTAFNLTMMYGLDAVTVQENIQKNVKKWEPIKAKINVDKDALMWAVNGHDDRSVAFAARLMELGVEVRIIDKDALLSEQSLPRGSVVVIGMDNPDYQDLSSVISSVALGLDLSVVSISSGFGAEELPDWGGRHFRLLERPQIALMAHQDFSSYDVGVSWWSIDHHLGIRHSMVNGSSLNYGDLRRYNTIIMPSGYQNLSNSEMNSLKEWVRQGGTLIAHNGSSRSLSNENGIGSVRQVSGTFDKSEEYNMDLQREFGALNTEIDMETTNKNRVEYDISYPWESSKTKLNKVQLENRDKWQSLFMPSGAFVAGRIDNEHWLTFGSIDTLPVLYSNLPVLMTGGNSEAAVRIGQIVESDDEDYRSINWSDMPPNKDLNVRMSGLVWPEASQRIANSAYLTRERIGRGQVILFAGEPNFRGAALGTNRLWLNAVVYGSGLGTSAKIEP
tara:strand:- start:186 stop:1892 length:1707 start_codon:yes stop_codon:yes gene_type:complete